MLPYIVQKLERSISSWQREGVLISCKEEPQDEAHTDSSKNVHPRVCVARRMTPQWHRRRLAGMCVMRRLCSACSGILYAIAHAGDAYLYADHAAGRGRSSDMLRSKPILSSAQRAGSQPPTGKNPAAYRPNSALETRCGG